MARTWNDCIKLGGIRCFISYAGFRYAYEQGVLSIKQASDVNSAKRIYINNKHITLSELALKFGVDVDVISNWRNQLWKSFSKKEKAKCIAYHNYKFLGKDSGIITSTNTNKEHLIIVSTPTQKDWLDTYRYFLNTSIKQLELKVMNQQQRLARVKQKQREYCLNYGMPESLIERNIAFAVTKFYAEEDKHKEQLKKKRDNLLHNLNMLESSIAADKKGYDHHNAETLKYHKLFSEATYLRNQYAKTMTVAETMLAHKQLELKELNKQLEN